MVMGCMPVYAIEYRLNPNCEPKDIWAKIDSKVRPKIFWEAQLNANIQEQRILEEFFIETLEKVRNFQANSISALRKEAYRHQAQGLPQDVSQKLLDMEIKNQTTDFELNVRFIEKTIPMRRSLLQQCNKTIRQKLKE